MNLQLHVHLSLLGLLISASTVPLLAESFAAGAPAAGAPAAGSPAFVTSAACASCHADAFEAWADSHHGWAWRPADPQNVLGDFNDAEFVHQGRASRFVTRNGRFAVETAGPDGRMATWDIVGTVGVEPLQQYLVQLEDGRLQALDMAWDTEGRRWYHLYPEQELEDDPGLHWSGPYKNWNSRCVSCHVTDFKKQYEPQSNTYQSTWSEMGVGCEACHGPGQAHVDWAQRRHIEGAEKSTWSASAYRGVDELGLTVSFDGNRQAELETCAGCHSRRESLGADSPPPGEPFADHFRLTPLREGLYHADGQIQGEVYVYGSFIQTKKHAQGVSCSDCHAPHSARLVVEGNGVCTQCHNPAGRPEFPTLTKALYDSPEHHRHAMGTDSASCVSCHMPETTYMGVDPRRDHSFRVPRPDLTVKLGTPNACGDCHADEGAEWARDQVAGWNPGGRHTEPHFAQVIDAGRRRLDTESTKDLLTLALDASKPGIVRATAVEMLAPVVTPQIAGAALPLLNDRDPWVRSATAGLFHSAPAAARTRHVGPLLDDPTRVVRIAAARRVLDVSTEALPDSDRVIVEAALDEYRDSLAAHTDFPEVQLNLARVAEQLGKFQTARRSLRSALTLDPKLAEAWMRLAQLDIGAGQLSAALSTLRTAIAEVPRSGALLQWLGRVEAQQGNLAGAASAFESALPNLRDGHDARLEYVSLLTELGRHDEAIAALAQLDESRRLDPQALYLAAINHSRSGHSQEAEAFSRLLAAGHPDHPLIEHLSSQLNSH